MNLSQLRAWFALSLVALIGCSLVVDTAGLEGGDGGAVGASGGDGGSTSSSSSGGSSGVDGGGLDAPGAEGSGGDASPCAAAHTVCADFDSPGSLTTAFPDADPGIGSVAVDAGSLLVTVPAGTDKPTTISRTIPTTPGGVAQIVCDFDYQRVDEVGSDANTVAILSFYASTSNARATWLELKETATAGRQYVELTAADGGTTSVYPTFDRISKPGGWVHVRQVLRFSGKAGAAFQSVTRDGAVLSTTAQETVSAADVKAVTIAIGVVPINVVTSTWRVRFDSVVCDVTPP